MNNPVFSSVFSSPRHAPRATPQHEGNIHKQMPHISVRHFDLPLNSSNQYSYFYLIFNSTLRFIARFASDVFGTFGLDSP